MSEDEGSSEEEDNEVISDQEDADADAVSEAAAAPSDTDEEEEEEEDCTPAAAAAAAGRAQAGSTAAGTEIGDDKGATPVGGEEGEAEGNSDVEVRVVKQAVHKEHCSFVQGMNRQTVATICTSSARCCPYLVAQICRSSSSPQEAK